MIFLIKKWKETSWQALFLLDMCYLPDSVSNIRLLIAGKWHQCALETVFSTHLLLMKNLSWGCKRDSSFCCVTVLHEGFSVGNNPLDASILGWCKQQPWAWRVASSWMCRLHTFSQGATKGTYSIFTTSLNLLGDEILIDVEVLCLVHSWVKLCWPALRWWIGKDSSFAWISLAQSFMYFRKRPLCPQIPHALGKLYDKADMLLKITSH